MNGKQFKKILIPTDFSENAFNAINYGVLLAKGTSAEINILHTYSIAIPPTMTNIAVNQNVVDTLERECQQTLQLYKTDIQTKNPGLVVHTILKQGFLTDTIELLASEMKIDLVIMGTKGASGLNEYTLGTNTVSVIEQTKIPVLVIPSRYVFQQPKKILYATDFQFDDIEAVEHIISIAESFDAEIEVAHIGSGSKDEDKMEQLQEMIEARSDYGKISYHLVDKNPDTIHALSSVIRQQNIGMLCMNNSGKSFIKKIFSGSMTIKMAYHTEIPFIVFHVQKHNAL